MRVLVTGGAGFIGNHLCAALVARGDEVTVVDSMEPQAQPSIPDGVAFVAGMEAGRYVYADPFDAVVHLAALVGVGQSMYEIERYTQSNTLDTAMLLERLIQSPPGRLIVASSMSVYGEGAYAHVERGFTMRYPKPRTKREIDRCAQSGQWEHTRGGNVLKHIPTPESKPLMPASIYAINKRDQEEMCLVTGAAYGIPTVALRFGNVYGPGQAIGNPYTGAIAIFASRARAGVAPIVYEDGEQLRDFTHVLDIVRGILLALDSNVQDEAINLGTGQATSVLDVAGRVAEHYSAPPPELPGVGRAGDVRHCYLNIGLAGKLLGFQSYVPLDEGLGDLFVWLDDYAAGDTADTEYAETVLRDKGLV